MAWIDAVNHFWFQEVKPEDWFGARPEFDAEIAARFGDLRADLKRNPPAPETLDAEGHVAAVIVFDQFSRNIFRESPEAFATDALALALACHALDRGMDLPLPPRHRHFLYLPFMHSEDLAMQTRSVALFAGIGIPGLIDYAEQHKGVIDRFGRFPHRNAALGRVSTDEELAFLGSVPPRP